MKDKLLKSAEISIGAAVLASLIMLTPEVSDWILNSNPIDWRPAANAGFTALMAWIINTLKVLTQNQ